MTIAIGMLAEDGVVIAADTQESYGYLKGETGKVRVGAGSIMTVLPKAGPKRNTAFAVSGSGNSPYVEAIGPELVEIALKYQEAGPTRIESHLREHVRKFYEKHVIPFSSYSGEERQTLIC